MVRQMLIMSMKLIFENEKNNVFLLIKNINLSQLIFSFDGLIERHQN